jgi:mycothiol synthase
MTSSSWQKTTVRQPRPGEETERWLQVRNTVMPILAQSLEELEHEFAQLQPEDTRQAVALQEGTIVGASLGMRNVWLDPTRPIAYAELMVSPDQRRHGHGTALLQDLDAWARDRGFTDLHISMYPDDPAAAGFAERHGFSEVERYADVELSVANAPRDEATLPEGVRLVTLAEEPSLARSYHEALAEAVPDVPGDEPAQAPPFEEWWKLSFEGPMLRPEAAFAAVADIDGTPTVVALAELNFTAAQPSIAWNGFTAVRRAWRGKGLARAVKLATLQYARDHGIERIRTENEERNAPMRHINIALGYEPMPTRVLMRRRVPDA